MTIMRMMTKKTKSYQDAQYDDDDDDDDKDVGVEDAMTAEKR